MDPLGETDSPIAIPFPPIAFWFKGGSDTAGMSILAGGGAYYKTRSSDFFFI